jgi:hypothetical protein
MMTHVQHETRTYVRVWVYLRAMVGEWRREGKKEERGIRRGRGKEVVTNSKRRKKRGEREGMLTEKINESEKER